MENQEWLNSRQNLDFKNEENNLIAPCGMNCGICLGYLREKNVCSGCRNKNKQNTKSRVNCVILNCEHLKKTRSDFCYDCQKYPCRRLKQLDKRYREKYKMSMLENLENIRTLGLEAFILAERERWKCPGCGGTICVHRGFCLTCN